MRSIPTRDGYQLPVRILGKGKPVLMLPGLGMTSTMWIPYIIPFAARFQFILPDFRGHGRAADLPPNQSNIFASHAQDIEDLIEHLRPRSFLLAGISLGASTALHFHQKRGFNEVERYLHIDQSPCVLNSPEWSLGVGGGRQPEIAKHLANLLACIAPFEPHGYLDELPAETRDQMVPELVALSSLLGLSSQTTKAFLLLRNRPVLRGLRKLIQPFARLDHMQSYLRAYSVDGVDYRHSFAGETTPVYVISGAKSSLYATQSQQCLVTHSTQSRLFVFEQAGHAPLIDQPIHFMRTFKRFLDGQE